MSATCLAVMVIPTLTSERMMSTQTAVEEGVERLRALGYKLTPQRRAVLTLFVEQPTHMTAQEIWSQLEHIEPGLSRATVYNTLDVLEQAGVLLKVQAEGGQTYYDPRVDAHHHAQCTRCGHIFDLDLPAQPSSALLAAATPLVGFSVESATLWLRGTCAACQAHAGVA
jgi:Fur family transcriptional regulator, peroxide stress response regulator